MDLNTLLSSTTVANVKYLFDAFATAASLRVTSWYRGSNAWALRETVTQVIKVYVGATDPVARGQWLDLSYDPGDVDPFDPVSATLPAGPGRLSALGENTFGTTRGAATLATGDITITNGSGSAVNFFPFALVFQRSTPLSDGSFPTYTNSNDADIYTNSDGSVTMLSGAVLTVPITGVIYGTSSDASAAQITILQTGLGGGGVTVSNDDPVLGADREDRLLYIERCKLAAARLSFDGPADAFVYFAAKNLDGTPLINAIGAPVNINRAYASDDSTTGISIVYLASPSGAAIADDVTAANANITTNAYILGDCITYYGAAAIEQNIPVTGTVLIKAKPGLTAAIVKQAILDALAEGVLGPDGLKAQDGFDTFPIGGYNQTAGVGKIYLEDLVGLVKAAYPGIVNPALSAPGGDTTLTLGEVAVCVSELADWTITFYA